MNNIHRRNVNTIMEQKELEDVIESISPDVLMVVDRERNIIMCNASVKSMFGYEAKEVINKKTNLLYFDRRADPFDRYEIHDKLEKEGYHIGLAIGKMKDGNTIHLEIITSKLKGRNGVVVLLRDISEHKRPEEKYNSLIENANDAVVSMDEEAKIIAFNKKAEEMFGYSRDELFGESFLLLIPPREREQQKKVFTELIRTNFIGVPFEITGLRKDGQEIPIENSSSVLRSGGRYILTVFIRDITERKKMEQRLLQTEKLKSLGELAGGVAHDFNNVLAAILGRVQLLAINLETRTGKQERRKATHALKKGLKIIEKAALDGAETVRRIQEFSRKRIDDKYFTQVDINELINDVLEFTKVKWKNAAESQGIKIKIRKKFSSLPFTLGSAAELREVFTNLINNAVDAMPQGGSIEFKTFRENSHILIKVTDSGEGIKKAIRDRLFDPFFTTKGPQSTGLGLSVSYGIISRHRGTISVDSDKALGTTFTIQLPLSKEATVQEAKKEKVTLKSRKQEKTKILVIDDEKEIRQLLSDILTDGGHEVTTASDGNKGIEVFEKGEFDLVFTDLGMPRMSGWQVAKKIKSINDRIPVALITGWSVDLSESEIEKSGVDLVAQKPFKVDQMLKLVQEGMLLRNRSKAV
ncbi:MAG: PAS domain S-box protein [Deltaproteobacteria bacterium]|nr:PAS domain S-box protein [Deltaproteobacteria bacterium]